MTEIVSLSDVKSTVVDTGLHGGALSIGNFDGLHVGHASLLENTLQMAKDVGGPAIACVFDPHPISVLRPAVAPKRLTTIEERARRMSMLGVDYLVVCETTRDLLNLSAEDFFHALVMENLRCRGMVEGENFCFGKDRRGNVALLADLCAKSGLDFRSVELQTTSGILISSTRIRDLLADGNVAEAAANMAAPHRIRGRVVHGDERGRTIGFPTANLSEVEVVVPAPGVYAAIATVEAQRYAAAVNLGASPTFDSGHPEKIEVHLLDFKGDLYDQTLSVDFIDRVRDIARFESAEALVGQLNEDVQSTRRLLRDHLDTRPPNHQLPNRDT